MGCSRWATARRSRSTMPSRARAARLRASAPAPQRVDTRHGPLLRYCANGPPGVSQPWPWERRCRTAWRLAVGPEARLGRLSTPMISPLCRHGPRRVLPHARPGQQARRDTATTTACLPPVPAPPPPPPRPPGRDDSFTCWPSEGGHVEFAPRDQLTTDLLEYLKVKFASKHRVSVERVVSGPGLANIYEFLRTHWAYEERVTREIDSKYMAAPEHMKGAIVAAGARARNAYPRVPLA